MPAQVLPFKPRTPEPEPIQKIIICPKCNAENDYEMNFCGKCGKALRQQPKKERYAPKTKHTKVPLKTQEDIQLFELALTDGVRTKTALRNLNLFDLGIAVGLRAGDLVQLKASHFMTKEGTQRDNLYVIEEKTGKGREIYIDKRDFDTVCAYVDKAGILYDGYLFPSQKGGCITRKSLNDDIIIPTIKKIGWNPIYYGSHTLRKTFAYQFYASANTLSHERGYRALSILCRELHHSSEAITLAYIGIDKEEVQEICGLSADQADRAFRQALRDELDE